MPGGDRTGPAGMGPMTGGARGYCAGFDRPGFANPYRGRGGGLGGGWGRGWRHWYYATGLPGWARFSYTPAWGTPPATAFAGPNPQEDVEFLKRQAKFLQGQLEAISQRIAELEPQE